MQRARNYLADEFVGSDATHLLFIDADIAFDPWDVLVLLQYALKSDDMSNVCGAHPKKDIAWEQVKRAYDMGLAYPSATELQDFAGDFAFSFLPGQTEFRLDETLEVRECGTGFMMIDRRVLERIEARFPQQRYRPDQLRNPTFDGTNEIMAFFDCQIDPQSKRYLSEDYLFCRFARESGSRIWLLPWIRLQHIGTYAFRGSLSSIAAIGSPPRGTAKVERS